MQGPITPHTIVTLPNSNGMQLLLCYDNEGVYVNTYGKVRNPGIIIRKTWRGIFGNPRIILQNVF